MGGAYLYSFDLAVFFYTIGFNLAGLPYSAGFLGKEFLLFQVLRDDLLSLIVRGCWLVSFLNTPIYMFTATFMVSFGTKNGALSAYSSYWSANFVNLFQSAYNLPNHLTTKKELNYIGSWFMKPLFQFAPTSSRTTSYLLFSFWCFFTFFGEMLLLVLFNFNTLVDSIPSSYFYGTKNHTVFLLNSSSKMLTDTILFYILFLTTCAFSFLVRVDLLEKYCVMGYESRYDFVFFFATT